TSVSLPRRRAPSCTPFPYTTLFRSCLRIRSATRRCSRRVRRLASGSPPSLEACCCASGCCPTSRRRELDLTGTAELPTLDTWNRSEEHTSELQSRENLVCRLLLEDK